MDITQLTAAQFAAYTLTSLAEPLPRGFILAGTGENGMSATFGVDPDADYPLDLSAAVFHQLFEQDVVLTVVHDHGLERAAHDAHTVLRRLAGLHFAAVVLCSGDYLMELPGEKRTTLAAASASLPAELGRPTELEVWARTRSRDFEPVDPATDEVDVDVLLEPWIHAVVTGRRPDEKLVAEIAAAIADGTARDRLLLGAVRLGFVELDDASGDRDVLAALLGSRSRPQGGQLTRAALVAQYVAAHTTDSSAAAVLYAIASLLLWSEARARAALHAAETALLHDRSCSLANTAFAVVTKLTYPTWFVG